MEGVNALPLIGTGALDPSADAKKPANLHEAAQQFEALMVGEMLKSARESSEDGWLGSGSSGADESAMDMAEAQFANALSKGGAFGLANLIEQNVHQSDSQSSPATPVSQAQNVNAVLEAESAPSK